MPVLVWALVFWALVVLCVQGCHVVLGAYRRAEIHLSAAMGPSYPGSYAVLLLACDGMLWPSISSPICDRESATPASGASAHHDAAPSEPCTQDILGLNISNLKTML